MDDEWDEEIEKLLTKKTTPHEKRVFKQAVVTAKYGMYFID